MDEFLASVDRTPGSTHSDHRAHTRDGLAVSAEVRRLIPAVGELIVRRLARSPVPLFVGVGGGPGAGKTTFSLALADQLAPALSKSRILRVSLEDFYLSSAERRARGYRWRAVPGTHDLDLLLRTARSLRSERIGELAVPRFDMATGEALPHERIRLPKTVCILEGWLVGYEDGRYGELSRLLDFLIFLDAEIEVLRRNRFRREQAIHARSQGTAGMSERQLSDFWCEALGPGITRWVQPIRAKSDLIIELGEGHDVRSVSVRTPRRAGPARG